MGRMTEYNLSTAVNNIIIPAPGWTNAYTKAFGRLRHSLGWILAKAEQSGGFKCWSVHCLLTCFAGVVARDGVDSFINVSCSEERVEQNIRAEHHIFLSRP